MLPPAVLDLVSVDGVPYAVPVDVHRANLLWANTAVLAAAGLDPTARYDSLDSWLDALAAVRASGHVPLALGSTWTQVHLLEAVLLSRLGPQAYAGLWDGTTDATSPAVATAVGDFARLLGYTNADRDSLDWQDAATLVAGGDAAFTVMGDWAQQVLDPPVVWAPFPGTDGVDDVVLDAFAVPVGAPHPEGAEAWLTTIAGAETQAAFANAKGAAPARSDVPMTALDTYPRTALLALRSEVRVPSLAHGMAAPPDALTRDHRRGRPARERRRVDQPAPGRPGLLRVVIKEFVPGTGHEFLDHDGRGVATASSGAGGTGGGPGGPPAPRPCVPARSPSRWSGPRPSA